MNWQSMESAPKDGTRILAVVDAQVRFVCWGKTSHVPIYGFCLVDQGVEDRDLCEPTLWMPVPEVPLRELHRYLKRCREVPS